MEVYIAIVIILVLTFVIVGIQRLRRQNLMNKEDNTKFDEAPDGVIEVKTKSLNENNSYNSNLAINPYYISQAGKSIKIVVYIVLVMIVCAVITYLVVESSRDIDTMKNAYRFIGIVSFFCNIAILVELWGAGNSLEKSVKNDIIDEKEAVIE